MAEIPQFHSQKLRIGMKMPMRMTAKISSPTVSDVVHRSLRSLAHQVSRLDLERGGQALYCGRALGSRSAVTTSRSIS